MAEECEGYTNPIGFFQDLQHGGCQSGMVGMFIYNDDCREFYINHIDSMEDFMEELEDELGCPIKNEHRLPHYTFIGSSDKVRGIPTQIYQRYMIDFP